MLYSNKFILICSLFSLIYICLLVIQKYIAYKNTKKTFDRLNIIFSPKKNIYKNLKIYQESIPRFNFNHSKKDRVTLLISGYRDVPNMWLNYLNYMDQNSIDYYAPRTQGCGRSFFQQNIKWHDWVLTYFEAIIYLSQIYKTIDIIGFSTGCNIAVYLLSHNWNEIDEFNSDTKFNNLILLSPNFEVNKKHAIYKNLLKNKFIYRFINFFYPVADKPNYNKKYDIDLRFTKNIHGIYYEKSIFLESLYELWKFADILPSNIYINSITIFHGDSDNVVGNFKIQKRKLTSIYTNKIKSYKLINCGHNIINEHPNIRKALFKKIDKILNLYLTKTK